jgi:hypothetical protein
MVSFTDTQTNSQAKHILKFSESNLKKAFKNLFLRHRKDVFLLEPQLGLGDSLVNIGLIKTLSSNNPSYFYYYACLHSSLHSVNWMFRDLPNIYPTPVNSGKEARQLADFYNCKHLYIGGPELEQRRFDEFYYKQHQVPFESRWSLASVPNGPTADQLFKKLNPNNDPYILVNATQSGNTKYKLKIDNPAQKKIIEVFPATTNIYDWTTLVLSADEIHTIDTSFVHFVENIYALSSRPGLFYHLARISKTEFTRRLPWTTIEYDNSKSV